MGYNAGMDEDGEYGDNDDGGDRDVDLMARR